MDLLTALRNKSNNVKPNMQKKLNTGTSTVVQIPIKAIKPNPNQPRQYFSSNNLKELSDSIRIYGVIQPITVRKLPEGDYELVSGERRVRASIIAGLIRIPAIVIGMTQVDSALVALIENVQRCDLTFLEEAYAYDRLLKEYGYTQEQLAIKLGRNQSTIANKVRLLKLPESVRTVIVANNLTERHARALLRLSSTQMQLKVLDDIVEKGLNVKQTDDMIDRIIDRSTYIRSKSGFAPKTIDIRIFSNTIKKAVSMMKQSGIKSSSIEHEYDDRYEYNIKIYK